MKFRILLSFLLMFSLNGANVFAIFSDSSISWYRDSIEELSDAGVISGFSDGTFGPEKTITRAEILKVYLRTKGVALTRSSSEKCFKDVPTSMWYHPYICEGVKLGIIKGFDDGTFGPDKAVTVLEGLAIGLRLYDIAPVSETPWYRAYQDFSDENGILLTQNYSLFTPMSRGRASELILRIRKYANQKSSLQNLSRGCSNPGSLRNINNITLSGKERSYILSIPSGYRVGSPVGLIVAIHGRTNSNSMVQAYMGLEGGKGNRNQNDFIVAYPAGLDAGGGSRSWSAEENITFFDTILRDVSDAYCVNRDDIFIVAHSLGAWFASKLACVRGDIIHGMGIVGGGSWTKSCGQTPTASLIYQNPHDTLSSPASARTTERVMRDLNTCGNTTESIMIGELSCIQWRGCVDGNPVIWCENYPTYGNDPHSWPINGGGDILEFFRRL